MSAFVSCIKRDEDGKHQRKTEQGGAAVTQERERNADNRHYAYGHAYVYEKVHEKTAGYAVAVYAREGIRAFFRPGNDSANQQHVKRDDRGASEEAPFFPDRTENEVRALLRNEAVCGLRAFQEAFSAETARTYGYH